MAEEIVYWAPAATIEQESFSSIAKEKEKEQAIYYVPPQTPQEAIEKGLIGWTAIKPKNWLHHWERLGVTHKPKIWHCWWGCEGVQGVMDIVREPTHDYYCPFWEMLLLFPEWEEDFSKSLYDRPPMPEGGPPLVEEEYAKRIAEKQAYLDSITFRKMEDETNPYNIDADQLALQHGRTRIRVKKSDKDRGKELARNRSGSTPFGGEYFKSRRDDNDNGWKFGKPKSK